MYQKTNYTWEKRENYLETEFFVNTLEKLKTYSKCINASAYSLTNTLDDVYNILRYKQAFWITLTNIAPDSISILNLEFAKGYYYNLSKHFTDDEILGSDDLRAHIENGTIKAANSQLFETVSADDWFTTYEPTLITYYGTHGTNAPVINAATAGTSFVGIQSSSFLTWSSNGTTFQNILIDSNYDLDSWKNDFQTSTIDGGYTVRNLLTSDKVFEKFLKNYNIIDVASTANIDITQNYPLLIIDTIRLVEGHKVLLKDQDDAKENGLYSFIANRFVLDIAFSETDDYNLFSVFIKEGSDNKNKQFFLDRNEDGKFPAIDESKHFFEGDNLVIRNRLSYRLVQNHSFSDVVYFTQNEPIIDTDFTYRVFGAGIDYYKISEDLKSITYTNGTNFTEYSPLTDIKFNEKIEKIGSDLFVLSREGDDFKLLKFLNLSPTVAGTNGTNIIYDYYETVFDITEGTNGIFNVVDFKMIDASNAYLLYSNDIPYGSSGTAFINVSTLKGFNFGGSSIISDITLPSNTTEFEVLDINTILSVFYLTNNYIGLNYNGEEYIIEKIQNTSRLIIDLDGNDVNIEFLENNQPQRRTININKLETMLSWDRTNDYLIKTFSKTKIDQWEIKDSSSGSNGYKDLYLKNTQITNLGTNFNIQVPKISTGDFRTYDGLNDYSLLSSTPIKNVKAGKGSFSVEFNIKPSVIRANTPVFYMGIDSKPQTLSFFGFSFTFQLPVFGYLSFMLADTDGYPYFILSEGPFKNIKVKANQKLRANVNTSVSFTWQYTTNKLGVSNKATGRLYFNGQLVGSVIDQRLVAFNKTKNVPLNIKNINFDKTLLAKSVIASYPLYKGNISEFRLWSTDLNPAQVLSRYGNSIEPTDILIGSLKGYWKLKDIKSFHYEEISKSTTGNIFNGGLNNDVTLPTIKKIDQLQLSADNLFILENKSVAVNGNKGFIYRIDLKEEKIYTIYKTSGILNQIYLENSILYFLENSITISKIISPYTATPVLAYTTTFTSVDNFAVVNDKIYIYASGNIFNGNDVQIFTNSEGLSAINLYGINQVDWQQDVLNIYLQDSDGLIHIISDAYANLNSLSMKYIGTYPFYPNEKVGYMNGTNSLAGYINGNTVILDGELLDPANKYWGLNLKSISGIYSRKGNLLVLVITINNEVQIWEYSQVLDEYTIYADRNGNNTFFTTSSTQVDLSYYDNNNEEYFTLLDPESKSLMWFKLEKGNKFNWMSRNWTKKWSSYTQPSSIDQYDNSTFFIRSDYNGQLYLSRLQSSGTNYTVVADSLEYIQSTDGWIIGDSGIVFNDNSSSSWSLELNNLIYKNDFSDLEVHISDEPRTNGYVVPSWSGLAWMIGKAGIIIRTNDNGSSWTVLDSTVSQDLTSISFYNDKNGLLVGDNDTILATFSAGDSFESINLPSDLLGRDWKKVVHYHADRAIIIGNGGTLIHLTKKGYVWSVDRVLNNLELTTIEKQILDSDLDNSIKLNIKTEFDLDQYQQGLNDVQYLGDNKFLICGERDLILNLELNFKNGYIQPDINYLSTGANLNWEQIVSYEDLARNQKRAFIISDNKVYSVEWNRFEKNALNNIHNADYFLYLENSSALNNLSINNNNLITVGDRVNAIKNTLFDTLSSTSGIGDLSYFVRSETILEQDLKNDFIPRLLFLDYYLGRKINVHLDNGGFEIPTADIPKSILSCYKFNADDSIELSDYGTVRAQNNFLAFQDYYFLNKRVLDGGINKFGKMEPWIKYNKKITAKSDSDYYNKCIWNGVYDETTFEEVGTSGSFVYQGTDGVSGSFIIKNVAVTDLSTYVSGLREDSFATKIQIDPTFNFIVNKGDVLNVVIVNPDQTVELALGDTLYLKIKTPFAQYDVNEKGTIDATDELTFPISQIRVKGLATRTVADIQAQIFNTLFDTINVKLIENNDSPIIESQISVETYILRIEQNSIVRYHDITTQTITLWDLYSEDIIGDLAYGAKIFITNLNYFNGNLLKLQEVFNKHFFGQSYQIAVREKDVLTINGVVNDLTKYYNLESIVTINRGTNGTFEYEVKYNEDVVYGPQYDLLTFLENINPVFTSTYSFDLPEVSFNYYDLVRNSLDQYREFTITDNKIYVGHDLTDILDFKAGTFLEISRGAKSVKRVYLNKIETSSYENYPDKKRYILHFDSELELNLQDSTLAVNLRTRNTLGEISSDLEFTDNLMFPLPNGGTNGVDLFNKSYFNQTKTSAAYASFILNDPNIRTHVSGIVYLDEEYDWNINIVDWKKDPNLYYRPIDVHEVGIDHVFKKAISIEAKNYKVDSNIFQLNNVDFEKYNFRLIDGLTLKELERKYYWVLNADMRNAIIGEDVNGLVWYQGDWLCGTWEAGIMYSGTIYNIEWLTGDLYSYKITDEFNIITVIPDSSPSNTIWFNGLWGSGNWFNGTWHNGTWNKGTRNAGIWYNGTWLGGVWVDGVFQGGNWMGGTWLNGTFSEETMPSVWNDGIWLGGDFENGVWKNGIWDQTVRVSSRFGTKASLLHKAVWESGWWKNGQFHSGITLNAKGEIIASINYKNATWCNGIWDKGTFYGGTWNNGIWNNGIWVNGLWQSELQIDHFNSLVGGEAEVIFNKPHYYKPIIDEKGVAKTNYFVIMGKPNYQYGVIDPNTEDLGYNTNPKKHEILEIIDEKTVRIKSLISDLNIKPFDYAVLRYRWLNGGTDLDTATGLIDLDANIDYTNINHKYLGYQGINNYKTIGLNSYQYIGPINRPYILSAGDSTLGYDFSQEGIETVIVDYKSILADYGSNGTSGTHGAQGIQEIKISLNANWYGTRQTGDIEIEFETYLGESAPIISSPNIVDVSNLLSVQTIRVKRNVTVLTGSQQNLGTLFYTPNKQIVTIVSPVSESEVLTCYDYTLETEKSDFSQTVTNSNLYYDEGPFVASHWVNGTWLGGVWEYGYHSNGTWKGGIWIDGVHEDGLFGE